MELLPGEVWKVSKRNTQYFRSYLRKTTGGPFAPPPPAGRGLISDSDLGSEQIVPARWDNLVPRAGTGAAATAPVPALHPCITYAFLHEKHSKFKSITRVQIASRFLHWNTRDIARSRFAGETPARSVTCIPTEKAKRDLNASDAVFLPFSDGENHLSIGSMV